ncbi:hypothetical protein [Rufibacter sp. XAAS-G3-1]|uniref:hypothetical protein n=1 Tax=Rufibacter sp. XAAS-G3-1 TaxID=2729134 RepID=UPI0015E71B34|nr:hypothetical protein [Rufibacter sp. XAAS-G3-1]
MKTGEKRDSGREGMMVKEWPFCSQTQYLASGVHERSLEPRRNVVRLYISGSVLAIVLPKAEVGQRSTGTAVSGLLLGKQN